MDGESAESREACRVQVPVKHAAEREEHMFPCSQLQMCSPVVSARHPNPSELEQQGSHLFSCLLNTRLFVKFLHAAALFPERLFSLCQEKPLRLKFQFLIVIAIMQRHPGDLFSLFPKLCQLLRVAGCYAITERSCACLCKTLRCIRACAEIK